MNNQKGKQLLSTVLSEIGLTIEDAKAWLNDNDEIKAAPAAPTVSCGCEWCSKMPEPPAVDIFGFASKEIYEGSNVTVSLGQTCDDTKVYVGGNALVGIAKAELKYDAELNIPMLYLEIIKPRVDLNHSITI